MRKSQIINKILEKGAIAVVRAENKEQGIKIVEASVKGGISIIEVTMTVPGALDVIKDLKEIYKHEDVVIGAGTVLDSETARACILNGAEFIVSPEFNEETVKLCNRYTIPIMPGIMTVNEAIKALEYGIDILKIFPGDAYGPSIIKAFRGPLPQANFMPTGGVNLDNVGEWIKAGAVAIGIGGQLTKGAKTGDYDSVTETAKLFIEKVKEARK
ncbi:bifunctional 4-hydroxy-2-oxoglutarate aldolase/2-dehydro-3-deoxy-phosphogluconate aldolase [Clostridium cochlearium]|uniref:Bifunctional 4-hydroxy-2-oxoglutarate aldolase/2-dehydro-3-deoxy-phosphogluconate aldolase n=1 Tax=Clostridium cochlearium TaxID=1494 RepID=A0A2X2Y6M1_CLOCO|nr:bifunctional 4-hydroxy-2-oxoglutarate aldolase/2-dehydro-3-deoxy-phosphogluconate aldolase [Clostridium cochlearium]NOH17178.1 bifunctional 4-hydroxy-2-oxoglutarate aldolase/2-dehydro-3-deoxy-phosphogluconate aldolase [Clostridium cochlearium]SQB33569.1 keto-hydroxyglutarate-aldolase/keto-deoxy-phosphogluconate aldolase [Clostridium cochlearium]